MPADFFRTIEDASGVDLDWFWRGWFYTTDHCDIAIEKIEQFQLDKSSPDEKAAQAKAKKAERRPSLSKQRDLPLEKRANKYLELKDFYNEYDPSQVTEEQRKAFEKFKSELSDKDKTMLESSDRYYRVSLKNVGGLIMPVILMVTFEDGTTREIRIPAEVWRVDSTQCDTLFIADKPMKSLELDPYRETADIDRNNNYFPPVIESTKFQLFKLRRGSGEEGGNPMQVAKAAEAKKAEAAKTKEVKEPKTESKPAAVVEPKIEPAVPAVAEASTTPKVEVKPSDKPSKKKKDKAKKKENRKEVVKG